jgi:hypothetical protein
MRTMIVFFIALFAIPVVQVVIGPRFERPGAPVLINHSGQVIISLGKRLRSRDIEYPVGPRSERPKAG